ncbi:MAG TPA: MASE3 domain-containing protein [Anaeromyxobacter sp.]|nr:MASE3 domain-containing protein [Anaeromyxobacter sp.]
MPTRSPARASGVIAGMALAALPIAVLLALRSWGLVFPRGVYLPVHTTLEVLVVSAGIATFAVQWFAAGAGAFREARALFIGPALLAASLMEAAHLLVFPGMPGLFGPATTERGIYYWLAARSTTVFALLLAVQIQRESDSPLIGRKRLLTPSLALVVLVVTVELLLPRDRAWFFVEGVGLTRLKLAFEALLLAAACVGAVLHARAWAVTREPVSWKLAVALALTAYSEACFMLYAHPWDPFNVLGHAYLVVSYWFVFDALFVAALVRPYHELDALRAHVEDELVVTIRQLRHTTEQREDLLRAVSHDLRNPLQIVVLQTQRLQRQADERSRRPATAILAASRRMDRMLRDLADAARSDAGGIELAARAVPLQPFVAELLEVSDGAMDAQRVENAVPEDVPPVLADPDRLDRILANLVGNALKYSQARVEVNARLEDGEVHVTVADRGAGISAADLPRIFDRYYRGQRHEGEGLGLGLYIVRKLVEAHGGRIWAESRPGEGSTFTFTLPPAPP